jgi:hypothetical protein
VQTDEDVEHPAGRHPIPSFRTSRLRHYTALMEGVWSLGLMTYFGVEGLGP